jgi:hypothetical protein
MEHQNQIYLIILSDLNHFPMFYFDDLNHFND